MPATKPPKKKVCPRCGKTMTGKECATCGYKEK
jgi:ribosomal protein L37E